MSLLVTGSLALDTVTSPFGEAKEVLGGTAVHFALAASFYTRVRLVGVVGDDFPEEFNRVFDGRSIDLTGLEVRKGSKTFRWSGKYIGDMNEAQTLDVHLNVLSEQGAVVPTAFADSRYVFLANTHPALQRELLDQLEAPRLAVCDTMNLWIANEKESLLKTLRRVQGVIINDAESRQLTGKINLIEAGEEVLAMGPKFVIIKKGEHGSLLLTGDSVTALPAYPSKLVRDPTGAGDSFAGGFMGYIASQNREDLPTLREAVVRGTIAASFNIEDFSVRRTAKLKLEEIEARVAEYRRMLRLE